MNINYNKLFIFMCRAGYLTDLKKLYYQKPDIDISAGDESAFTESCENGHLDVAKWLYEIKPTIDISVDDEGPFSMASISVWHSLSRCYKITV